MYNLVLKQLNAYGVPNQKFLIKKRIGVIPAKTNWYIHI